MREVKYIIARDSQGKLRHFKSEWKHHLQLALDNGITDTNAVLECGIFLDKKLFILECFNNMHLVRRKESYIGNRLYQDERLSLWLQARELESAIYYNKKAVGLREGD